MNIPQNSSNANTYGVLIPGKYEIRTPMEMDAGHHTSYECTQATQQHHLHQNDVSAATHWQRKWLFPCRYGLFRNMFQIKKIHTLTKPYV